MTIAMACLKHFIAFFVFLTMLSWSGLVHASLLVDLTAYWRMEEAAGTRFDSIGSNHLTDNNGVPSAAGIDGLAAQFTAGNDHHLSIPDNAALSMGDIDFTVSSWVYMDTVDAVRVFLNKGTSGSLIDTEYRLFQANAGDTFRFGVGDGVGDNTVLFSNFIPVAGAWDFVIAWHDSTAHTLNMQVNNGSIASAPYSSGGYDSSGSFNIGRRVDDTQHWNGRVDEVGIWKRLLTVEERASLYNDPGGLFREPPSDNVVPEPSSLCLLGAGLFGMGLRRRRIFTR